MKPKALLVAALLAVSLSGVDSQLILLVPLAVGVAGVAFFGPLLFGFGPLFLGPFLAAFLPFMINGFKDKHPMVKHVYHHHSTSSSSGYGGYGGDYGGGGHRRLLSAWRCEKH